jgi:hypothetical protein
MVYIGFPMADLMGQYNTLAIFGFLWHYPQWQAFIIGLANASYTISAVNATIFLALVGRGWTLIDCFYLVSGMGLVSAIVSFFVVPTMDEFNTEIRRALGITLQETALPVLTILSQVLKSIKANLAINAVYITSVVMQYLFVFYWISSFFSLIAILLGPNDVTALAEAFSPVITVIGSVGAIFLGTLIDIMKLKPVLSPY